MKKELGQYFTSNECLLQNVKKFTLNTTGNILEPSCGAGHIVDFLVKHGEHRNFTCIEIDTTIEQLQIMSENKVKVIHDDFLNVAVTTKFTTIVGNPPYVKRKGKCNLYIEFIDKCVDLLDENGELIFIIPSDFFMITSASHVKKKLMELGSITHVHYPHDESLFKNAAQDVIIFRFQKGESKKPTDVNGVSKTLRFHNGNVYFIDNDDIEYIELSDIFEVKVGMVSGADKIFKNNELGNISIMSANGSNAYILHNALPDDENVCKFLNFHKQDLISRKIRRFDESNWYQWGCLRNVKFMESNKNTECIYCATLTRKKPVFKKGSVTYFDGSLLCLFPKCKMDLNKLIDYMNSDKFLNNFFFAGRYKLGQKSLSDCHLPKIICSD